MDNIIGVVDARIHLPQILRNIHKGIRYVITQRSKAKAVLVSLEELETLEVMADKKLLEEIKKAKKDIASGHYKTYKKYFKESPQ